MRLFRIKVLIFLIVLLFGCIGLVSITVPLSFLLAIEFVLESGKKRVFESLYHNSYGNKMVILLIFGALSLLWTPDIGPSLLLWFVVLLTVINSYLIFYFVKRYNLLNIVVRSVIVFSIVNYTLAFNLPYFQFLAFNSDNIVAGWGGGRFTGVTSNPNTLAVMLIFSIFLSLWALNRASKWHQSIAYLFNILFSYYVIFLTMSKKGLVFSLVLIILYTFSNISVKKISIVLACVIATGLVLLNNSDFLETVGLILVRFDNLIGALDGSGYDNGSSSTERIEYINIGLEGFKKSPIWGHGWDSFRYFNGGMYSHNNFIELLFSLGIIGLIVYYAIHLSIIKKLLLYKADRLTLIFVLIIVTMDVGLVSYSFKGTMLMLVVCSIIADSSILQKKINSI